MGEATVRCLLYHWLALVVPHHSALGLSIISAACFVSSAWLSQRCLLLLPVVAPAAALAVDVWVARFSSFGGDTQVRFCVAVARERLPRYSTYIMDEVFSAYQAFHSSAANAEVTITNFCNLQRVPDPPRIDVPRIAHLEKLADELEMGLADAKRSLEETPPLAALKDLKTRLSALREQYGACLQQWRKEGGQELTPPRLWRRLGDAEKVLKKLYQDVCDHLVFAEAEEEETVTMPPGKVEELVRAAHEEESGKGSR